MRYNVDDGIFVDLRYWPDGRRCLRAVRSLVSHHVWLLGERGVSDPPLLSAQKSLTGTRNWRCWVGPMTRRRLQLRCRPVKIRPRKACRYPNWRSFGWVSYDKVGGLYSGKLGIRSEARASDLRRYPGLWWKRIKLYLYEGTKVSTLRGPAQLADLQGALCVPHLYFNNCDLYLVCNGQRASVRHSFSFSLLQKTPAFSLPPPQARVEHAFPSPRTSRSITSDVGSYQCLRASTSEANGGQQLGMLEIASLHK